LEYSDLSRSQLLDLLRRYDTALHRILREFHEETTLHAYRRKSATGPDDFEKGRLDGYADTARIAAAALDGRSEYAYPRAALEAVVPL
jgi:hypothetical protein